MMKRQTYLVTGASGTIGSELISILLNKQPKRIYIVLRAKDQKDLLARFEELKLYWQEETDFDASLLVPVLGDIEKPNLGITPEIYTLLKNQVTKFIHTAGNVRMNLTEEQALKENSSTTKNCLGLIEDFYKKGTLNKAEFVSTIGIVGRYKNEIPEDFLIHEAGFHNSYEKAKYECEKLIKKAINSGLPITVHRPSMVIGNSKTGRIKHFQVFYFLISFLSGEKSFGILPNFKDYQLDIIPVDYVAESILKSSETQNTIGKVLHLCSGEKSVSLKELSKLLNEDKQEKSPIKFIPMNIFSLILKAIFYVSDKKTKKSIKTLPWFLTYLQERQVFTNHNTLEINKQNNLSLPNWKDYIYSVLKYHKMHS